MVGTLGPLFGALGLSGLLVLAMACANAAMLMMLRMRSRERDISVRLALGASRARLLRQLFVETFATTAIAGACALMIASWSVGAATAAIPRAQAARMPGFRSMGVSLEVAAFVLVLIAALSVILTLAAGWRLSGREPQASLHEEGRSSTGHVRKRRTTSVFVGAQVALAMVGLAGAALLVQSVRRVVAVSPGFEVKDLLTMRVLFTASQYPSVSDVERGQQMTLAGLRQIAGVQAVGGITSLPLTGPSPTGTVTVVGRTADGDAGQPAAVRSVWDGYFSAMGIPLLAGRAFNTGDTATSKPVALVNRALADSMFGGNPIGERIRFPFLDHAIEIVGVVGNERFDHLDRPLMPAVYRSASQSPSREMSIAVRTGVDPASIADDAEAAMAAINPRIPIFELRTMENLRAASRPVWMRRYVLALVGTFALIGLLLSAIGVYGVVGESVVARRREFGIRLALGATRREVMSLVVRQGAVPVAAGLAAGLIAAVVVKAPLEAFLFRTAAADLMAVAGAAALLATIALTACVVPSRRASRTDPAITLRA
jgi:putative ABC transport system permease protein